MRVGLPSLSLEKDAGQGEVPINAAECTIAFPMIV